MKKFPARLTEQGSILMVTLIMLLIASVIGIIAVTTSTTGISMSGNYNTGLQTFYTADSVTKYVMTNPATFNITSYAAPLSTVNFPDPGLAGLSGLGGFFRSANGSANVTYLSTGLPPPGTSSRYFQANYFVITTTATGPNNAQDIHLIHSAQTVPKVCGQSC